MDVNRANADLVYECPNAGPHGPHTWRQGFCAGIESPSPVLCPGSDLFWVWDKGAAVCPRCHEPATWMGLRAPRRKDGSFRTKVPPHVNRMPGKHEFSQKAQIEMLKDEVTDLREALGQIADCPDSNSVDNCHNLMSDIAIGALVRYGVRVKADNQP